MADQYGLLPRQYVTPEQRHQARLKARSGHQTAKSSWIPGVDAANTLWASTASSFLSGWAADAKTLDYVFDADFLKEANNSLREVARSMDEYKTKASQESASKEFIRDDDSLGEAWTDLHSWLNLAGSGVGSMGAMIAGGGILKLTGKLGLKAMTSKAVKKRADEIARKKKIPHEEAMKAARGEITDYADKYSRALGITSYGSAEMAIVSGSVGQALEEEVMRAPPEVLNSAPGFQKLYKQMTDAGMKHNDAHQAARVQFSREVGIEGAKKIAVPSFMLGTLAGNYIDKAITGRLTKSTLKNFGILQAVEIPTEAAQGATEQYVQNKVYKDLIDKTRNVWSGVKDSAFKEGVGVAFGAAPLSLISARAEADYVKGQMPEEEEVALVDTAMRYDEAATEAALDITDPVERFQEIKGIITRGQIEEEGLDIDENYLKELEEGQPPVQEEYPPESDPTEPPTEADVPETTPESTIDEDVPPEPANADEGVVGGDRVGPPAEPQVETPPVEEEPEPEPAPEPEMPAHKVDFDTYDKGVKAGQYNAETARPEAITAQQTGTEGMTPEALESYPRSQLNAIGKAMSLKTTKGSSALESAILTASDVVNMSGEEIAAMDDMDAEDMVDQLNRDLKEPIPTRVGGNELTPQQQLALAKQTFMGAGQTAFNRQAHREAIEDAVESGDFTLEDFNALPFPDQRAYADIGRRLRRAEIETPPPAEETPPPAEPPAEEAPETPPDEGVVGGGPTTEGGVEPEPEPEAEPEPETEPEPEVIGPPEPTAEQEQERINKGIEAFLTDMVEGTQVVIEGTQLTTGQPMNALTALSSGQAENGDFKFMKGKNQHRVRMIDGVYYVVSPTGKRTRKITRISEKVSKSLDEDIGAGTRLFRWQDFFAGSTEVSDAEKYLASIDKATSHATFYNKLDQKANNPGVRRALEEVMGNVPPFKAWIGPHIGGSRKKQDPRNREAVLDIIEGNPRTQYDPDRTTNIQTIEDLNDAVAIYAELLTDMLNTAQESQTVTGFRDAFAKRMYENDTDLALVLSLSDADYMLAFDRWRGGRDKYPDLADDQYVQEEVTPAISKAEDSFPEKYRGLFPKFFTYNHLFQIYEKYKRHEDLPTEALKGSGARPRHKLDWLFQQRKGMPDHRKGKNVSSKDIMDDLGFEGVTFGNWVKQEYSGDKAEAETQRYRNMAYDAFMDLAYLLGHPPKSMGKDLFLTIGALGRGKATGAAHFASAHRDPTIGWTSATTEEQRIEDLKQILYDNDVSYNEGITEQQLYKKVKKLMGRKNINMKSVRVINFTREHGDGTVAHEWAHNLGNKLATMENAMGNALRWKMNAFGLHRKMKRILQAHVRKRSKEYSEEELLSNLKSKMKQLMWDAKYSDSKFMKSTSFYKESKRVDDDTNQEYWSTYVEMFARATEAYVHDRILQDDANNPFLQGPEARDGYFWGGLGVLYPEGEERQYFNELLDAMFKQIEISDDMRPTYRDPVSNSAYDVKFGSQRHWDNVVAYYDDNMDQLIEEAHQERSEALLEEMEAESEQASDIDELTDDEINDLFTKPETFESEKEEEGPKRPKGERGPRGPRITGGPKESAGGGTTRGQIVQGMVDNLGAAEDDLDLIDDIFSGTRLSVGNRPDSKAAVSDVAERNAKLDPTIYEAVLQGFLARWYNNFLAKGGGTTADFARVFQSNLPEAQLQKVGPYAAQFILDIRDGHIDYRDYLDPNDERVIQGTEGAGDGAEGGGRDDAPGVQRDADQEGAGRDGQRPEGDAAADGSVRDGGAAGVGVDSAAGTGFENLTDEQKAQRIYEETGFAAAHAPAVAVDASGKRQIKLETIVEPRGGEAEYSVSAAVGPSQQGAVSKLSSIVGDLDEYVAEQLGYESLGELQDALYSFQVESVAAAIYQMSQRNKSVIIADQTGVGKGRQAGAIIRWAINNGKTPVFVTKDDNLFTDMYYDMLESGTDFAKPFITKADSSIMDKSSKENDEDKPALIKNTKAIADSGVNEILETGKLPAGTNVMFTTYSQMNTQNQRRDALDKLTQNSDVVLILDESHEASKYKPMKEGGKEATNNFFTRMINQSYGTTYLSATFAKNPQNLGFYFNTDLADAMDSIEQLIVLLSNGGPKLQELMSRTLFQSGQLFRREIDYSDINFNVRFNDLDEDRDRKNVDAINKSLRDLIPVNQKAVEEVVGKIADDLEAIDQASKDSKEQKEKRNKYVMDKADLMLRNGSISIDEHEQIKDWIDKGRILQIDKPVPVNDSIHNLVDQIMVASKADAAVEQILQDLIDAKDNPKKKSVIALDKTNLATLNEFIAVNGLKEGDSLADYNWAGIVKQWADKSYQFQVSVGTGSEKKTIRGRINPEEMLQPETFAEIERIKEDAVESLKDVNIPLSPIDYIQQTAQRRAKEELSMDIKVGELTGRHQGAWGIDYSGAEPKLVKVPKFNKNDMIDGFNGIGGPATIDALILNRSGSTGISLHSSVKHGDQTERHMTVIEPNPDINVFQQMLGRIFRTGMAYKEDGTKTKPYYTILGAGIPSDQRKINSLMIKMASLNAQTSSNRKGSADIEVEDLFNQYGDEAVQDWIEKDEPFQRLFPNWDQRTPGAQYEHPLGFAYWVTGKYALMDYGDQEAFYEFVLSKYQEKVQTAINDGTYEFADRFEDYQAEYREEIELAKGRGNKLGFAGGAWLVKFLAKVNFKAQTAKEVDELVEKNLDADYSIPDEWMEVAVTKPVNEATALANDYFENRYNAKEGANLEEMDSHKEAVLDMFEKASKYLLGEESYFNIGDYQLTNIAQQVSTVKENLAKGTISDKLDKEGELTQNYNTVMQKMNTLVRMAKEKEEHDKLLAQMIIGETAQYDKGEGVTAIQHYGTVTNIVREVPEEGLETKSPFATGRITIDLSVNKPGVGANESGTLKQPLSRFAAYNITPVSDFYLGRPDELSAEQRQTIYKVYHEDRAERAQSKEKWIAVGNPLAAVQELVNLGQYIQFTDYSGRRLYGIEMTEKAVQDAGGISGLVKGNVEITDGAPWAEYVRDNPYDELSVKFGIHTRSQNIQIKRDQSDDSMMRFIFKPSAYRKLDDADLQSLMKGLNVKDREVTKKDERTGKDEKSREFVISISDSGPLVSKIAERSRLVVLNSNKHKLADYIEIPGAVKATGNERKVPVNEVQEYVFENGIKAIRGTRKNAKDGALKSGFYVTGLGSKPVSDIASISGLKGAPDTEFAGLPFIMEFEWEKGTPFHGMEGKEGLGSPLMNESTTISGGKFSVAAQATEAPTTTMADAQAELVSLPQRLKRLLTVVQSETDLPKGLQLKIKARGVSGNVRGAFHGGRIYIIADALGSREEAMMVWLHEAVGHLGIQKIMGEDLDALLDQIAKAYPQQMRELGKKYKVNIHTKSGRREVAEEILAHAAESGDKPTLMQQIRALFRKLMRKLGFDLMLNDDDIRALLSAAQKAVYNSGFDMDEQMAGPTRYSIRSRSATDEAPSTRLPNDSVIQGIRDGQPVDAVFRGIWKVAEATQLPRAVRVTSAASLRAATNFYDQKMPWAHPTMNYLAKALIDQHGLSEEYKRTKAHMSSKIAVLLDEVRDIIEVISHTAKTEADFKKIQEILVNEAPREEAWDAVTEPIRKRIEELGQEAVNYGLITQESYDRNKGAYLHRVYTKYEQERTSLEKWADGVAAKRYRIVGEETMERGRSIYPTEEKLLETLDPADIEVGKTVYKISRMSANGQRAIKTYYSDKPFTDPDPDGSMRSEEYTVRAKVKGRTKLWRDWTKQERTDMGEIVDARYTVGKTFALLARDLATGEFFEELANNPEWTMPQEEEKAAMERNEIMDASQARKMGVITGTEWVRVPDTKVKTSVAKVYGALAGRVVRAEVYQDLYALSEQQKPSVWKTILTEFKLNKTARNPVVHFNNVMSNLVLMDMADVRFTDLYRAIVEMRTKGSVYQEAKANAAFGSSFAEMELKNDVLDVLLDDIHEVVGSKPIGLEDIVLSMEKLPFNKQVAFMTKIADKLWHGVDVKGRKVGLRAFDKKMLNYYQHEDEIFRLATYMRRREQGMDAVEAGMQAKDQFLNYDISAPWINAARASFLPFISYTYRAIPIVAKSLAQRPWKLAKYFTIAYAMNAIGYALSGGDEEKERKSLREEVSGKMWIGVDRLIRMPWNNEEGNPYFWDVRRLIPIGDVFDMNQYHAALPIIPSSLMPSGPGAMFFEFVLNKTGFFGEEIVDPLADDWVIGTQKSIDWLWKGYGPSAPWIPYSYYWDKVGIAMTGGRDRLGREYKILPALASSFGIKIAPHDVKYGMGLKAMDIERRVEAIRNRLSFLEKDYWQGKMSKDSYEHTKSRYFLQLKNLEEQARDLVR